LEVKGDLALKSLGVGLVAMCLRRCYQVCFQICHRPAEGAWQGGLVLRQHVVIALLFLGSHEVDGGFKRVRLVGLIILRKEVLALLLLLEKFLLSTDEIVLLEKLVEHLVFFRLRSLLVRVARHRVQNPELLFLFNLSFVHEFLLWVVVCYLSTWEQAIAHLNQILTS